jgi:hypothetical protein
MAASLGADRAPLQIHHSSSSITASSKELNCGRHVSVALGMIILIGSLVAAGFLYAQVGYWSLALAGSGLIVGSGLIAIGLRGCKTPSQPQTKDEKPLSLSEVPVPIAPVSQAPSGPAEEPPFLGLPKDFSWNISGPVMLTQRHLHRYITYLATQFPGIGRHWHEYRSYSIETLMTDIDDLSRIIKNFEDLNFPFYVQISGHWALVYIDREKRTVEYYDSMKESGDHRKIDQKLNAIANRLSYQFIRKTHQQLQSDPVDDGVWTLYFLESKLNPELNSELNFDQLDFNKAQELIKNYRKKVAQKLIEMDRAMMSALEKKEQEHKVYTGDPPIKLYQLGVLRIPIERWRQILNGQ